jgi:hypothetical protein
MGYPKVQILNSTQYVARGTVHYLTEFCSIDDYSVTPPDTWTGSERRICLVTEINALLKTPNGEIRATSYTSSGTSYSQYAIVQTGPTSFEVNRRVSGVEDSPPADYVEPTEKQK